MSVQDIDRPDINGKAPKMVAVCLQIQDALKGLTPFLRINTNDNFCSSVDIKGSYEPADDWPGQIWENSRYFSLIVSPKARYYTEGDKVSVEINHKSYKLPKMRKYTGPVDKVIKKIVTWVEGNQ